MAQRHCNLVFEALPDKWIQKSATAVIRDLQRDLNLGQASPTARLLPEFAGLLVAARGSAPSLPADISNLSGRAREACMTRVCGSHPRSVLGRPPIRAGPTARA
jgi:hypothetical protein